MKTIGEKIVEIRKQKGLSQEAVSDMAKINLRTLQRIEKGETEPHGHTLRILCEVLEINVEELLDYGKKEDKSFLIYVHLFVMAGIVIPLGDIIIPMILWLANKNKVVSLDEQGKNILNFRIVWTFFVFALTTLFMFGKINHIAVSGSWGSSGFLMIIYLVQIVVTLIYPIFVAVSISKRKELKFYYPKWINIIR